MPQPTATLLIRHLLATLRYRFSGAIHAASPDYPQFDAGNGVRKPVEILHHMCQVLRYAQYVLDKNVTLKVDKKEWEKEVAQFYLEIKQLDQYLASGISATDQLVEKLLQGPLSDAMTHVGQLAMLRRMAGNPIPKESFFDADIKIE